LDEVAAAAAAASLNAVKPTQSITLLNNRALWKRRRCRFWPTGVASVAISDVSANTNTVLDLDCQIWSSKIVEILGTDEKTAAESSLFTLLVAKTWKGRGKTGKVFQFCQLTHA